MNHLLIALIVFTCLFGSALVGSYVRQQLPSHHLSDESVAVLKLATGLIATMSALVLGLLVSSAKGTFETTNNQLESAAAKVVEFDRVLARYGPDTQPIRTQLKHNYAEIVQVLASRDPSRLTLLDSPEAIKRSEALQQQVAELSPTTDTQRTLKASALQMMDAVFAARWLTMLQANQSIPPVMLVILITWLSIIFGSFGLFAPRNGTIVVVLLMCSASAAATILLVEELNRPLDGLISVSLEPMVHTMERLGQ
ncbi:bestrophin-like domain [Pseudomonas frederiksbergensis]|uniref:DUF4239 domain-containing protein n=1 Tax=Pseudomonas frederiksbergensis TaxID=104087 RepID=A0A423K0A3_9PSED|nr:DUF4239 domain-containing protein [Pseudomonas frederiksbergensis]RON43630.1 hypothetical protein BK666_21440 [Pseudomonas frederiksbergensis]RON56232.1 hypothetical protein BK667_07760 [Pseudomonas frederiksbergensis]